MSDSAQPTRRTFRRADRVSGRTAFARVFGTRCSASDGRLVVYVAPNDAGRCRLGLSVSRRAGGAVRRNRIKRLLREAFRLGRGSLPEGLDIVVVVKPDVPAPLEALGGRMIRLANEAAKRYARGRKPRPGER